MLFLLLCSLESSVPFVYTLKALPSLFLLSVSVSVAMDTTGGYQTRRMGRCRVMALGSWTLARALLPGGRRWATAASLAKRSSLRRAPSVSVGAPRKDNRTFHISIMLTPLMMLANTKLSSGVHGAKSGQSERLCVCSFAFYHLSLYGFAEHKRLRETCVPEGPPLKVDRKNTLSPLMVKKNVIIDECFFCVQFVSLKDYCAAYRWNCDGFHRVIWHFSQTCGDSYFSLTKGKTAPSSGRGSAYAPSLWGTCCAGGLDHLWLSGSIGAAPSQGCLCACPLDRWPLRGLCTAQAVWAFLWLLLRLVSIQRDTLPVA